MLIVGTKCPILFMTQSDKICLIARDEAIMPA